MAKFCERNVEGTDAKTAIQQLEREYSNEVEIRIVDCFRRCLQCRVKPFCRIQLTTIEAEHASALVDKVMQTVGVSQQK
ncbi:DUF1450 domain-containing protein [Ammoniphilus sp. 3BR4]|uniref:DUF1450 domain-containing protein n=1 Tax=Ammoniphilus sp. 3BR4 TaxID=3158265 RepID=UPI003467D3E4